MCIKIAAISLLSLIFIVFSGEISRKAEEKRRTLQNPMLSQGMTSYPIRPAPWLDFKKRKGTCSTSRI